MFDVRGNLCLTWRPGDRYKCAETLVEAPASTNSTITTKRKVNKEVHAKLERFNIKIKEKKQEKGNAIQQQTGDEQLLLKLDKIKDGPVLPGLLSPILQATTRRRRGQ